MVVYGNRGRFALLAIDHVITRDKPWLIGIRLILAAGFGACLTWSSRARAAVDSPAASLPLISPSFPSARLSQQKTVGL